MSTRRGGEPIRFGTNGWRGILAEDFTLPRLRRALHGVARFFRESGGREVVVAHDTRFLGEEMVQLAARCLAAEGLAPLLARGSLPTPAATRAVRRRQAAGAVVLTASHNPSQYQGLKVFGPSGACIDDRSARRIEAWIARAPETDPGSAEPASVADLRAPYVRDVLRQLDAERMARSGLRVAYDAMHGAGAGVLDAVLARAGVEVALLRGDPDPRFGGSAPDPSFAALAGLRRVMRGRRGPGLGLATDGDADRFAAVDAGGRLLPATDVVALLVDELASSGRVTQGVALSLATGSLVARVAEDHGLPVFRRPIGFKHLSKVMAEGRADVAVEESGGFALESFGLDKDGILAGCLLAEIAARDGEPLGLRLARLRRRHRAGHCGQTSLAAGEKSRDRLERLRRSPPGRLDGERVGGVQTHDGLHLAFADGFLMLRLSGTEPVLRVYAEAAGVAALRRRLELGAALAKPAGSSPGSR